MKIQRLFQTLPFFLFFFLVTIPTLMLPRDMWDGTVIEYASLIKNYSGLKTWFIEGTWYLQYPLSVIIIELSHMLGLPYKNTNAFISLFFMFIFLNETFYFAKHQIKLPKFSVYLAVTLAATFPAWGNLLSSVMTFHLGCMALGLLSVRIIHYSKIQIKFLGFIGLLGAFGLQSQLLFLPILSYIYDQSKINTNKKYTFIFPSLLTIQIFLIALFFFIFTKNLFPPFGLYENSYKLKADCFYCIISSSFKMSSYLLPIVIFIVFVNILSKIINHKHTKIKKVTYSYNSLWQLLVLFVAGTLPYVFMNKFSIYWSVKDWGSRHGFLLIFPTSLFTALCCQILVDKAKSYFIRKIVLLGGVIIIVQSILLLGFSVLHKLNRQVFVTDLENLIKKIQHEIEPGLTQIIVNKIPAPQIREGYESNFLMYKATGKANFWTRIEIEENKIFTIPCEIRKNIAYQVQYI